MTFLENILLGGLGGVVINAIADRKKKKPTPPTHNDGILEVVINLQDQGDWQIFSLLETALKASPKVLKIQIIGLGHLQPTAAIAIYHLLRSRMPSVRLEVDLWTSLYDGAVLLVLVADTIRIRSDVWMMVDSVEKLQEMEVRGSDGMYRFPHKFVAEEPACVTDTKAMNALISQYLPLVEICDKRLPIEKTLKEFGLLASDEEENQLQRLFAAT